jgi:hypothetical protein
MDKYIFQIVQKENDVLIIIIGETDKFIATVNEDTFKLPYLKNKDLVKFISKILDKHSDSILKMDYSLENIDAHNLKLKIYLYDGNEHNYEIILKSKDTLDQEILDDKLKNIQAIYDNKLLKVDRKYDDACDELQSKINNDIINLKYTLNEKDIKTEYRNYKFRSLQVVKNMSKINKVIEIYEEIDNDKLFKINNNFYEKIYDDLKSYDDFIEFMHKMYNEKHTNDPLKKIKFAYNYLIESNIYNIMDFIFNSHGTVQIIYLNLDFNKSTNKLTLNVKFLYDDSEYRNYKCFASLYNQNLSESKLIYHNFNNSTLQKKDNINVFIFEKIK